MPGEGKERLFKQVFVILNGAKQSNLRRGMKAAKVKPFGMVLALVMAFSLFAPVPGNRQSASAEEPFISLTVIDYNNDGIKFGSANPGEEKHPADWEHSKGGVGPLEEPQGCVTLIVGKETTVDVDVQLRGEDFTCCGIENVIGIGNVKYNDIDDPGSAENLTASCVTWYTVPAFTHNMTPVYHWISIPGGQKAGDYSSTFCYQAIEAD